MGFIIGLLTKKWPRLKKYEFWLKLMTDLFYMGLTLIIFLYIRDAILIESQCAHVAVNYTLPQNMANFSYVSIP